MEEEIIKEEDDEVIGDISEDSEGSTDVLDDDDRNFQKLEDE